MALQEIRELIKAWGKSKEASLDWFSAKKNFAVNGFGSASKT
jgi:hypothetical protein